VSAFRVLDLLPLAPPTAILAAATFAWLTRRAERLKDAYAEWATAVFRALAAYDREAPPASMSMDQMIPNPQWTAWSKEKQDAVTALLSTRAVLQTREPSDEMRARVYKLSALSFRGPSKTNLPSRMTAVDNLIAQISKESWLILSWRDIDALRAVSEEPADTPSDGEPPPR